MNNLFKNSNIENKNYLSKPATFYNLRVVTCFMNTRFMNLQGCLKPNTPCANKSILSVSLSLLQGEVTILSAANLKSPTSAN